MKHWEDLQNQFLISNTLVAEMHTVTHTKKRMLPSIWEQEYERFTGTRMKIYFNTKNKEF